MDQTDEVRAQLGSDAPLTTCQLNELAVRAIDLGLADEAAGRIGRDLAGDAKNDARLWQTLGLAYRKLHDSAAAHAAFGRAATLAPRDALIAQSLAHTALEAGYPAVDLFAAARAMAPANAQVLLGQAAALLADGRQSEARHGLAQMLKANPGWLDGHATYAKITAFGAPGESIMATLDWAIAKYPDDWGLRAEALRTALKARDYARVRDLTEAARQQFGASPELTRMDAICLSETGGSVAAQTLFEQLPPPPSAAVLIAPLRNLIRLGRYDEASRMAELRFDAHADRPLWPYRALLWRRLGDARWEWLEGDSRLIGSYDLGSELGDLAALGACLRQIHVSAGNQLDQSVRGGTQTDGDLFARDEPEIRKLRKAVLAATRDHIAHLPPPDANHPTLFAQVRRYDFAGSWSVRLSGRGFHVDHVHPYGWFSSAFYVALPDGGGGIDRTRRDDAGWLTFGENRELMPELAAFRSIEPQPGRLALFPSLTWHGTRPFSEGERMTVAFDIALPSAETPALLG